MGLVEFRLPSNTCSRWGQLRAMDRLQGLHFSPLRQLWVVPGLFSLLQGHRFGPQQRSVHIVLALDPVSVQTHSLNSNEVECGSKNLRQGHLDRSLKDSLKLTYETRVECFNEDNNKRKLNK